MNILYFAKALVPSIVSIILIFLGQVGVTPEMSMNDALTLALTSILVYFVPNKQ